MAQDPPKLAELALEAVKPELLALLRDLSVAVRVWVSLGVAHLLQLWVLSWGWSVDIVHLLDKFEEKCLFATISVFLMTNLASYCWTVFNMFRKGWK